MPADPFTRTSWAASSGSAPTWPRTWTACPVHELADLLGEPPSSRQQPLQLGVLMVALNERLPDAFKLLSPAGHPGPGEGRRRSLRQVVADRRAARASRHAGPPASGLAEWLADRQPQADLHADRARAGAVAERRVAGRCAPMPATKTRRLATSTTATRRPSRPTVSATGRRGSATASPRITSATVGAPTGSAPATSARPTAEGSRAGGAYRAPGPVGGVVTAGPRCGTGLSAGSGCAAAARSYDPRDGHRRRW
jgi:hypothetical protein